MLNERVLHVERWAYRTDKSRHTHTEKGCDTQEDERHSDPIFDIFDANLWVYFRKPREGVSLFIHVTLSSPDVPQISLSCRNSLAPVHPLMAFQFHSEKYDF
jgi:hypothetical protein